MADVRTYVSDGQVQCPVDLVDRDVEHCFRCQRLKRVNDKTSPPYIVCDVKEVRRPAGGDPPFVEFEHHRPRRSR